MGMTAHSANLASTVPMLKMFNGRSRDESSVGYYLRKAGGGRPVAGRPERAVCLLAAADALLQAAGHRLAAGLRGRCPTRR
jgi:hypothetical protein